MEPPSGAQFVLEGRGLRAVVTEVGATLREFVTGQEAICRGFPEAEMCHGGMGQVLAPWPNRLGDGYYRFGTVEAQAALDEPEHHNAIHGLVRWLRFTCQAVTADSVTLAVAPAPQPAYPFSLRLELSYAITSEGLSVRTTARNEGKAAMPFGIGFHPYFAAGPGGVDGAALVLAARRHLVADSRGLPRRIEDTPAHLAALFTPGTDGTVAPLGAAVLDDCFTDLQRDSAGRFSVDFLPVATGPRTVRLAADSTFSHVMCYTGDHLPPGEARRALAIEPMTCAPNALHDGSGLIVLDPGEDYQTDWSIELD